MKSILTKVGETNYYYNEQGQLHRVDGPAVEWPDGSKKWYLNGNLHSVEGPAILFGDGSTQYAIEGKLMTEEIWKDMVIQFKIRLLMSL